MRLPVAAIQGAWRVWVVTLGGIAVIGAIDYVTGVEIRVFPLYYAPISFVAWYLGRTDALIAAALCALVWLGSNLLTGLRFSGLESGR